MRAAAAVFSSVAVWLLLGLWWISRLLAGIMPNRVPWKSGPLFALAAMALGDGVAALCGFPLVGGIPLLYGFRIRLSRPPSSPRDA